MEARRRQHPRIVPTFTHSTDIVTAYYAHYENIRQHLTVEDFSRADAMIALRLRATGHSQQAVTEGLRQCAPTIREKNEAAIGNAMRNALRPMPSAWPGM